MTYSAPNPAELPPVFLTTFHGLSMGGYSSGGSTTSLTTGTWPLTNRIYYVPFTLNIGVTVFRLFWANGSTVGTNNLQAGVYDAAFSRVIAGTSTLSAGASVCQFDNITDTYLGPGRYYMALWCNGTTATVVRLITGTTQNPLGPYYETNASGLPTTGTPADTAVTTAGPIFPLIGLALRATDP